MLSNMLVVGGQVGTLFLMMGVGFLLTKRKKLSQQATSALSYILLYVVAPCLVIEAFQLDRNLERIVDMGRTAFGYTVYFLIGILLSFLFFRKTAPDRQIILRAGLVYPNVSFMGFPLIRAVLGPEAMPYAAICLVVFIAFQWTHGVAYIGGKSAFSVRNLILNPGMIGLFVGGALFALDLPLPSPVGNAVGFLASMNTPLAMLIIGAQMANSDLRRVVTSGFLYGSAAFKLLVLPTLTALVLLPFHFPPLVYCTLIILAGTPTAGVTAIFAQQFRREPELAAQAVTLSTLLSIFTLPVMTVLSQALAA